MSKKATRRAARQAFPKAKNPPPQRTSYGSRPKSQRSSQARAASRSGIRPPSVKRAVIWGAIMALIYFLVINYTGLGGDTSTMSNLIVALIGFVVFAAVTYGVDRWKYNRYQRKQKGSPK